MVHFEKRSCELRKSLKGLANLCCKDYLRQKLMGVFFDNGFMVATDAHGLLKVPAKVYGFVEEELELLEGKIIPSSVIKELSDMKCFGVEEGVFKCETKKGARVDIPFNEIQETFPNYEYLIRENLECELSAIGLNADILKRVQDAMPYTSDVKLTFTGGNKTILVESNTSTEEIKGMLGVVMPCMIN